MKNQKTHLRSCVDRLLPDENFFAYKTDEGYSEERKKQEKEEIKRLIDKVTNQGGFQISNEG